MTDQLPDRLVPHLQNVSQRMFDGRAPLDFWRWGDDQAIITGFMDLAALLELAVVKGESPETWPNGYRMIMQLFGWEGWAQSDGWSQYFEASDAQIAGVCSLYRFVGLPEEAKAITRAHAAVNQGGEVEDVSAAYSASTHDYSHDLDRLDYLAKWFRDNADFYLYKV